jgi:hypothetical protein
MDPADDKRALAIAMRRTLAGLPIGQDVIATTEDELSRRGDLVGSVLRPPLQEGRIVHERRRRVARAEALAPVRA